MGAVYGHMIAVSDGASMVGFRGLPRGTGVLIPGALFFFEKIWARPETAQLRGLPFLPHLIVLVGAGLFPAPAEVAVRLPIRHQDVLFSFAVVLALRFIDDINHLLGQGVLLNFIIGRYHRPRLEHRVFLFIDIEGSTALAERSGEFALHRLINRFVVDITEPIVAAYGEIHRYVGDELIATWKLADGIADALCVRAYSDAPERLIASQCGVLHSCTLEAACTLIQLSWARFQRLWGPS